MHCILQSKEKRTKTRWKKFKSSDTKLRTCYWVCFYARVIKREKEFKYRQIKAVSQISLKIWIRLYIFVWSCSLGTNRVDESLPALLVEAECAWLKLRCWEDFRRESQYSPIYSLHEPSSRQVLTRYLPSNLEMKKGQNQFFNSDWGSLILEWVWIVKDYSNIEGGNSHI